MKNNSVIYFYNKKDNDYSRLNDFCTKNNIHFFCCTTIDELMYLLLGNEMSFIVVSKDANVTHRQLEEIANVKKLYYFDTTYNGLKKNIILVDDMEKTITKIINDNLQTKDEIEEKKLNCYLLVNDELERLCFRHKHLGTKYLEDMVYEQYVSKVKNKKCIETYPILAEKYDTTVTGVERSVRFAIRSAFNIAEDKQMFYSISKRQKSPTVKEMVTYLLNKVFFSSKENM